MKANLSLAGMILFLFLSIVNMGQKRYALIISGDPKVFKGTEPPHPWPSTNPVIDEFWNDEYSFKCHDPWNAGGIT